MPGSLIVRAGPAPVERQSKRCSRLPAPRARGRGGGRMTQRSEQARASLGPRPCLTPALGRWAVGALAHDPKGVFETNGEGLHEVPPLRSFMQRIVGSPDCRRSRDARVLHVRGVHVARHFGLATGNSFNCRLDRSESFFIVMSSSSNHLIYIIISQGTAVLHQYLHCIYIDDDVSAVRAL